MPLARSPFIWIGPKMLMEHVLQGGAAGGASAVQSFPLPGIPSTSYGTGFGHGPEISRETQVHWFILARREKTEHAWQNIEWLSCKHFYIAVQRHDDSSVLLFVWFCIFLILFTKIFTLNSAGFGNIQLNRWEVFDFENVPREYMTIYILGWPYFSLQKRKRGWGRL